MRSLRATYGRQRAITAAQAEINRQMAKALRRHVNTRAQQEHADAIMRAYEEAYVAAHGRAAPRMDYSGGWYVVASKRLREADMIHKTRSMWAAVHARELGEENE